MMMVPCSISVFPPEEVRFDRPFLLALQDIASESFVFVGQIKSPEQAQ